LPARVRVLLLPLGHELVGDALRLLARQLLALGDALDLDRGLAVAERHHQIAVLRLGHVVLRQVLPRSVGARARRDADRSDDRHERAADDEDTRSHAVSSSSAPQYDGSLVADGRSFAPFDLRYAADTVTGLRSHRL